MSRKSRTPYVISVLFKDGRTAYLKNHHPEGTGGPVCGFTTDISEAIQNHYKDSLFCGWGFLLRSHQAETGELAQVVGHKITEKPIFQP